MTQMCCHLHCGVASCLPLGCSVLWSRDSVGTDLLQGSPSLATIVAYLEKNHVHPLFFLFSLSCSAFHIKESSLMAVHGKQLWIYAFADGVGQMEI